ncbi:aminopeptidase-like protein [Rhizobium sp. BK212]|uniref:DUF4910 domain-containing protein n=1 Tax=unclassified Rhizobium TaxID=2613769 RepID=UPI0017A4A04D|nr:MULTISPECIES: DUF4910 domain-containing protein [unclassified Rhizobium]MBB4217468.1 aminopeptidase-like protein [Rhizobium sp. BK212]MBB4255269.1 aminopeptidase-like protein [Rhizobium sp. BK008]
MRDGVRGGWPERIAEPMNSGTAHESGQAAYDLACELFPINRSITGPGVRQTLAILTREMPGLTTHSVLSGTQAFDWVVPDEWDVREAYIEDPEGNRIVDFKANNLHLMGYSEPVNCELSLDDLQAHLYSLPDQPDAIPYVTSYYSRRWGFCLSHHQRLSLKPGQYRVRIDSTLAPGNLNYGEILIAGDSAEEIFLSTYICHPSMANNELSGPVVTTEIVKWLISRDRLPYSFRVIFIPETIGSICYLSRNLGVMKERMRAGFNITCVGDDRAYSFLPSRDGNTLADRAVLHALEHVAGEFERYSWWDRGSDERQYCAPGIDLPVASIMRSKYGVYPEYHTSLDNLDLISPAGLGGAIRAVQGAILAVEQDRHYKINVLGEPQLGKRGLYPTISTKTSGATVRLMMNVISQLDGRTSLLEVSNRIGVAIWDIYPIVLKLVEVGLVEDLSLPAQPSNA